ncbi:MAG: 16S rRNA (cytosine(967)-C(5))-methyltransferase RsmB [Erysipelotrichaceae bacterium]|nr:16S rRNA (cytosine(967)-C(5))-methyltransferase RsmB [Erysipelotrichaceae bacterium]
MKARVIAYNSLKSILMEQGFANLVLRKNLHGINAKDKGLITSIVYGTLRNDRFLKAQYEEFIYKQLPQEVDIVLMMSTYQLFLMDKIPVYAIVNEAVDLTKVEFKNVVNAILRKVCERGIIKIEREDNLTTLAINTSFPDWIIRMWNAHYGFEITEKIAYDFLKESKVYGRINTILKSKEELSKDKKIHFIDDIAFTYDDNLVESNYFKNGEVIIQDISSQQVCKYLDIKDNLEILDCCSAPGTKVSQISMMMNNTGKIIAIDLYKHRVELISALKRKMRLDNVEAHIIDATTVNIDLNGKLFDRVLVDAPCSGLGVLKGKPDIKQRVLPEDIDNICILQKQILNASSKCLKIGGILVYSTCTLNKKENEKQIEDFISRNPNFLILESLTIFPFENNGDGFYICKLARQS